MERQLNYLPGYLQVLALAGCGYPGRNLAPTEDRRLLWTASEVLLAFLFLVVLFSKHTGGVRGRQLKAKHEKLMPVKKYRELFDGALVFCIMSILVSGMAVVMLSWVTVDNQRKLRSQKKHLETVSQLSCEIQALKSAIEGPPEHVNQVPLQAQSGAKRIIKQFHTDMTAYTSHLDKRHHAYRDVLKSLASTKD